MLAYYHHMSIFVFFLVFVCSLLLASCVWEWKRYTLKYNRSKTRNHTMGDLLEH